ncbi:hypothetical protein [uncultured Massilia sp.]|uniref:hypothetical protein n=1 Tax=uncultured Massilia sp. TaxID=169973 RepID=UPI0025D94D16|nr:hypothetical protein [uncultured Massilia sp.]
MIKTTIAAAAMLAAALGAPAALAQSHSVPNMANPPQGQADSKPGTEATPGRTATADRQDARHPGKGQRDAKANKPHKVDKGAKHHGSKDAPATKGEAAGGVKAQLKPDPDISKAAAGNETKEAMQVDPSEAQMNDVERHALDQSAAKK